MIRKNAVESILAERDILITVRNPFVVSEANLLIILFSLCCFEKWYPCSNICFNFIRFDFSILLHVVRTCILSWSI
jgi:hypothetical protein